MNALTANIQTLPDAGICARQSNDTTLPNFFITDMTDISSLTFTDLETYIKSLGEPSFRAKQIYAWLSRGVMTFDGMTDISKSLREKLHENCTLATLEMRRRLVDPEDGTTKYLFALSDGLLIETVVMKYKHGNSVCISSQAGCRMGCRFCASTLLGKERDLTAGEMLAQVAFANADAGVTNVVVMGVGEPLDNFDNLCVFLENLHDPRGLNISHRHVSVSTCGIVPKIYELAEKRLQITLSVSLHAPDDETRSQIMPINSAYNVETLMKACDAYVSATNRRISYEYTLIKGVNDTPAHARRLASLMRGRLAHVNLIPVNYVSERGLVPSDRKTVNEFCDMLLERGINATLRRTLGDGINAACGQLRLAEEKANNK